MVPAMTLFVVLALAAGACTSGESSGAPTTTTEASTVVTIDPVSSLVDACRQERLSEDPSIERLALDPSITNLALGLLADDVTEAAQGFADCLGPEDTAIYLATEIVIGGQPLPPETGACFASITDTESSRLA